MLPVLARVELFGGEVVVPAYGTFLVLAALVGGWLAVRGVTRAAPLPTGRAVALVAVTVLAGLVGARAADVALDAGAYAEDPGRVLDLAPHGFALAGGLAGSALAGLSAARRLRVPAARLADHAVEGLAGALVLLRVGCFLNGCCGGVATDLPWGVVFPVGSAAWEEQLVGSGAFGALTGHVDAVHPTQLYEAVVALLAAALAVRIRGRGRRPAGSAALVFAAGFLAFRVANQAIRPDMPGATLPHEWLLVAYAAAAVAATLAAARVALGPRRAGARTEAPRASLG